MRWESQQCKSAKRGLHIGLAERSLVGRHWGLSVAVFWARQPGRDSIAFNLGEEMNVLSLGVGWCGVSGMRQSWRRYTCIAADAGLKCQK